jgi:hypothetical protein
MAELLGDGDGPLPSARDLSGAWIESRESVVVEVEWMFVVDVVHEPDRVRAVAVEVKREDGTEPDTRDDATAEVTLPAH